MISAFLLIFAEGLSADSSTSPDETIVVTGDRSGQGVPVNQIGGSVTVISCQPER